MGGSVKIPGPTARWRHGVAGAVGVVIIAIVAGVLLTGGPGSPTSGPTTSPGPSSGVAISTAPASAAPSLPPEQAWSPVQLAPHVPTADLRADRADAAGLRLDTTFTLASLTGADPKTMASRLETEPPLALSVAAGPTPASVVLRPAAPLAAGRTYRFTLRAEDGTVADSWAFQSRAPLHVVSTLPGNGSTAVPIDTGIEVTFDQDGAADMAPFFSISPTASGTFERRDRTQVFVPKGLRRSTLYTVTIRRGLPVAGTDLGLEQDIRFRFETSGPTAQPMVRYHVGRDVIETSPSDRAVIGIEVTVPEAEGGGPAVTPPSRVAVRVYRFASRDAALARMRSFLEAPTWTEYNPPAVKTSDLSRVLSFMAPLRDAARIPDQIVTFPRRLARGWYLVEVGGDRPAQAFLQVTEVSAWVDVLADRTVVWVNDVATGRPIGRAEVGIAGGVSLGRTGTDGLLVAPTPAALTADLVPDDPSAQVPILLVQALGGHTVLVPFEAGVGESYRGEWSKGGPGEPDDWWSLLSTDRSMYRRDDQVRLWGFLRRRADGDVPAAVDLRLIVSTNRGQADPAAIARATVRPSAGGAYATTLSLQDAPPGTYRVEAVVDGKVAAQTWLEVGVIRKPSYRLEVLTDRHVVIAGQTVRTTIVASFFDGQPVPATRFNVDVDETTRTSPPTGTDGRASLTWPAGIASDEERRWLRLEATPARPEEGEIFADADVLVFPSTVHLDADGSVLGRRLVVSGSVHAVDLARIERQLQAHPEGYQDVDPNGRPVAGATVTAAIYELIPIRHIVGYDYDPIAKRVVPRYDYEARERYLRTATITTRADGAFRLSVPIPNSGHEYRVRLATADQAGRSAPWTIWAARPVAEAPDRSPVFESIVGPQERDLVYRTGETVRLTMTDGVKAMPTGGSNRYLYIVAQQGLRSATVTSSPRFSHRFTAGDAPGIFVIGVRFSGRGYDPKADAWARFDTRQRQLTVKMSSDRTAYRPGDTATIQVRTTDARGRPVPATVTLRAVDEKLFAMGLASVIDPLADLYAQVGSGVVRLTSTHQLPIGVGAEGEGGAAGGGGGESAGMRDDFRDTLFFRQLETDADGRATVSFTLSDDLTAWHLSASAVTASLSAGEGQLMVKVSLPFFVEATIADEYLASDRPIIRLRAFGSGLRADDPVTFTVASSSLGLPPTTVRGTAFTDVSVPLPTLPVGSQAVTVEGTATAADGTALADRLVRTFDVVRSRTTRSTTASAPLTVDLQPPGGPDLTTYTFSDAGRGRFVGDLRALASLEGPRVDQALARVIAHDLLVSEFGYEPTSLPPVAFDPAAYPVGAQWTDDGELIGMGLPLLPYAGPDPVLAARVALLAPERFDRADLRDTLYEILDAQTTTRELRLAVLAGLAGLGEPVLVQLRAAGAASDLTIREQLDLALGYQAAGDDAAARTIERDLLTRYGEQMGSWTRLRVGSALDNTIAATADLALVAAGIGDPIAASLQAYVDVNPASDELHVLDQVAVIERMLARTPSASASFAYTVDGRRTVVDLSPGDATTLVLTAAQRQGLRLEPLGGQVQVTASWSEPADVESLRADPALELDRTVTPSGTIGTDRLVVVDLVPIFGAQAVHGCYQVVDLVPSGLAPVARTDGWVGEDASAGPYRIVGQRVEFYAMNDPSAKHVSRLRYLARVVTPGVYTWEPAVMQLADAPGAVAFTRTTGLTIADR
jgi:hypothetical protein